MRLYENNADDPGLDDGAPALGDGRHEVVLHPGVVDEFEGGTARDGRVRDVGDHGRGVIPPDAEVTDVGHVRAGLLRKLRERTVLVEAQQSREGRAREIRGVQHRDAGVRVAGVPDHEHLDVSRSGFVQGAALRFKDRGVRFEEVGALHAGAARTGTD